MKCLQTHGRQKAIDIGGGGQSSAEGLGGLVRPPVGPGQDPGGGPEAKPLKLREFCRFSTLKINFFLVPDCMGFEQLKYSPPQSAASQQQSPEKHKLISHSKQEDKKPLRSYQFGSSADHLVICGFAVRPILMFRKSL